MKPILLKIEGLQSFREEQVIRFDELSEMGVFGIFGPTGSGKSSILDAITLALYGEVGRASGGTRGILNHAEKSLSVSFEFAIGSPSDRQYYRVERRFRRKDEISVNTAVSRFVRLDNEGNALEVLADRANDVTAQVQATIGLKSEDFSRAVVLPQGKFAEFLQLKGSERRQMLQRLFSLEQYGTKLVTRLNDRLNSTTSKHEVVVSNQTVLGDLSPEAMAQAEKDFHESEIAERAARIALDEAQNTYKQNDQLKNWQDDLLTTERKIAEHQTSEDEMRIARSVLEKSERAEKVLPFVTASEEAIREHEQHQNEQSILEIGIRTLEEELEQAQLQFEKAKERREKEEPVLIARKANLEAALDLETEIETLATNVKSTRVLYDQTSVSADEVADEIAKLTEKKQSATALMQETQTFIEQNKVTPEYRNAVLEVKSKADEVDRQAEALEAQRDLLQERENNLTSAQNAFQDTQDVLDQLVRRIVELQDQANDLKSPATEEQLNEHEIFIVKMKGHASTLLHHETELEGIEQEITKKQAEVEELIRAISTAQAEHLTVQEEVMRLRMEQNELRLQDKKAMAAALATNLFAGQECPVCGSLEHPRLVHQLTFDEVERESKPSVISEALEKLTLLLSEAETIEQVKYSQANTLQMSHIQVGTQLEHLQESRSKIVSQLTSFRGELYSQLLNSDWCTGEADFDEELVVGTKLQDWVTEQIEHLHHQREQFRIWKVEQERIAVELNELQNKQIEQKIQRSTAEEKVKNAIIERDRAKTQIQEKEQSYASIKAILEKDLQALGYETSEQALLALDEKEQAENKAHDCMKLYDHDLKEIETSLNSLREKGSDLRVQIKVLESQLDGQTKQLHEKEAKLTVLTAGQKVQSALEEVQSELEQIKQSLIDGQTSYDTKVQEKLSAQARLTEVRALCEQAANRKVRCDKELQHMLTEENFTTAGEVRDDLLMPQERLEKQETLKAYEEELSRLQNIFADLEQKLQGKRLSDEEWEAIVENLGQAKSVLNEATVTQGIQKERLEEMQRKYEKWRGFESSRVKLQEELGRLNELKRVFRGTEFVEFMAQEQLEYVARQASERLKQLTRGRYALEIDTEGFVMRDDANGGVRRPVTTLSGGETFLTSLALALSLSSQIQLRGQYPLEFFFLDEGFGTLDPELLDVVMSTLEALHLEKMTIGVISHVPELRQRMSRRLIVDPAEPAGRGSRVTLERA